MSHLSLADWVMIAELVLFGFFMGAKVVSDHPLRITVYYNGLHYGVEMRPWETVARLMARANTYYKPRGTGLALFDKMGRQLKPEQTMLSADLHNGDELLLRPTVIR